VRGIIEDLAGPGQPALRGVEAEDEALDHSVVEQGIAIVVDVGEARAPSGIGQGTLCGQAVALGEAELLVGRTCLGQPVVAAGQVLEQC
jgi:hypothetical protein